MKKILVMLALFLAASLATQAADKEDGVSQTAGVVKSIEPGKITLSFANVKVIGKKEPPADKTYTVADDAKILKDGKVVKLQDLKVGTLISLTYKLKTQVVVAIFQNTQP